MVRGGEIVDSRVFLIRPPTPEFVFTYIHGIEWRDVRDAPTFGELWPRIEPLFREAEFLAAHNAPFDRGVLAACCARYRVAAPRQAFECTVRLARAQWGIRPTKLPDVCGHLGIALDHHDAGSDARACASIVIAAERGGWSRARSRWNRG